MRNPQGPPLRRATAGVLTPSTPAPGPAVPAATARPGTGAVDLGTASADGGDQPAVRLVPQPDAARAGGAFAGAGTRK
jgi:hypothetical protein